MKIRKALLSDSNDLLLWRNDEITRKYSINNDIVTQSEHDIWFNKKLADDDTEIYIGYGGNSKIGMVRIEKVQDGIAEIHININPTQRGKGYGSSLLAQGVEASFNKYDKITAKIIKENVISIKTFEKVGFRIISINEDVIDYSIES